MNETSRDMMNQFQQWSAPNRRRRAFTVVELLVVITIIVLLVSLGTVAATKMRSAGEMTSTRHLMNSVKMGLTQFKEDLGYYPPLLGDVEGEDTFLVPVDDPEEKQDLGFYSTLTIVPYLLGIGDLDMSGGSSESSEVFELTEDWQNDGKAGLGFADPGRDRSWGYSYDGQNEAAARTDYWEKRSEAYVGDASDGMDPIRGEAYGPYVEMTDETQLARAVKIRDRDPEDPALEPEKYELILFEIRDYWGRPIRYYRDWMTNPQNDPNRPRFPELYPGEWAGAYTEQEFEGLKATLRSAPFLLFSMGPDRQSTDGCTIAEIEDALVADVNKDNILEIGE